MSSTHKKTPPTGMKKKTTASARAKVNLTNGSRKKHVNQNDGSYLGESSAVGSNQAVIQTKTRTPATQVQASQANGQILALLQDLKASNDTLTSRIDRLERNSSVSSTPVTSPQANNNGLPRSGYTAPTSWAVSATELQQGLDRRAELASNIMSQETRNITSARSSDRAFNVGQMNIQATSVPSISQVRGDPGIAMAVSQLLTQYDLQARSEALQGKGLRKRSGLYRTLALHL